MASFLLSISPPHLYNLSPRHKIPSLLCLPPLKPFNSPKFSPVLSHPRLVTHLVYHKTVAKSSSIGSRETEDPIPDESPLGEDSAAFQLTEQKLSSWVYFTVILGSVLLALNVLWINPSTGFGTAFVDSISNISGSPEGMFGCMRIVAILGIAAIRNSSVIQTMHSLFGIAENSANPLFLQKVRIATNPKCEEREKVTMLVLMAIFAIVHSGLASLRDQGEKLIGERAFRVLFAGISLPLVVSTIVYFINHRYDGTQLWQVQAVPGVHELVWFSSFVSFFFLYPSTFNLLEVAAVDKPKMHLWETGIMRITRHPQMVGQVIWCLAHTLWIGNTVAISASVGLIAHHLFGVWNGDRRLSIRYGKSFEVLKKRTSAIPFAAILDGRQKLPEDYYKEFLRLPYVAITVLTLGAYFAHPLMQSSSYHLHW